MFGSDGFQWWIKTEDKLIRSLWTELIWFVWDILRLCYKQYKLQAYLKNILLGFTLHIHALYFVASCSKKPLQERKKEQQEKLMNMKQT